MKKIVIFLVAACLLGIGGYFSYQYYLESNRLYEKYIGSNENKVEILDEEHNGGNYLVRGSKVNTKMKEVTIEDKVYYDIYKDDKVYYVLKDNLVDSYENVVFETELFVRTNLTVFESNNGIDILGYLPKGSAVSITGFNSVDKDGNVDLYKIGYKEGNGFVYSKYLVNTNELADAPYSSDSANMGRDDVYGGGDGASLDYYPYEKANFDNNKMPAEVKAYYINSSAAKYIDDYISLAKESGINAMVIDVKGNGAITYGSDVMKEISPKSYDRAVMSRDDFKGVVKKCHDNGLYVIGRISAFNDEFYALDHPEYAICDNSNNAYLLNSTYWPSAFQREVWEYNVKLALDAVDLGVNEIQFDYMRFPDRTYRLETNGVINLRNDYGETKAQALQTFAMYATDAIHKAGAYVSADVFGETSNAYVTAYGQYWPALSNIVDVMSAMPYPDHFGEYSYGLRRYVWEDPYSLLLTWGKDVVKRQGETTTPAKVRTWIQAYNAIKYPYVVYDSNKVYEEIKGLRDAGLVDGYMTWNSGSSYEKYAALKDAFKK